MGQPGHDVAPPRALLVPCLLLLLAEAPSHGYELMAQLKDFGFDWGGPGPIYEELRRLADTKLLRSWWEQPNARGPARRVYEPSGPGLAALDGYAESVGELDRTGGEFLLRYRRLGTRSDSPARAHTTSRRTMNGGTAIDLVLRRR